ncbi:hypothetical protein IWW55_002634, partial [Coemansia sp. RSA 2706]
MSANYTQLPPSYGAASQPQARTEGTGDDIPDDLKYGVSVWQSDRSIRHAFMRKVYAILTLQLLATAVVGGVMRHADATNGFLLRHVWTVYAAMFGSIGALLGVMWKRDSHPTNAVLLGLFTVLEAYTLGAVTA